MEKRISIFEVFGNNIITRNSMSSFFEEINSLKKNEITLDFEKVTFISRSCADEYLKQRKASKKKVVEVNMSKNVCDMFELVNRQYQKEGINLLIQVIPECNKNSLVFA
jgi:anti-anti-sigma regulatory factor